MAKYEFNEIFREEFDGRLTPKKTIKIKNAVFGSSVTFGQGVLIGGIDIFKLKGHSIEADVNDNGIINIKGFYDIK